MKSRIIKLASLAAVCATLSSAAFAINFSDQNGSPTWLSGSSTATGTLDLTAVTGINPIAYNPATMVLTSATVKFAFADTNEPNGSSWYDENDTSSSNKEYVTVTLDLTAFASNVEVDGTHANFDWTSVSGALSGSILTSLQTDGKLNYVVSMNSGDVWFKGAQLDAVGNVRQNTPGVPDSGSTIALMGAAMLAVAAFRRRF